jgi:putative solute:sodium symporter small subunit
MNDTSQKAVHWNRTRNLMIVHMVIWFIFSFVVHWYAPALNKFSLFHFPLGYYMAAQGSLVVFVVQLFIFDWQQQRIDRECGMAEAE